MFHYRLIPLNNQSRLCIAAFLAVVLHIGFSNFEFDRQPVLVPGVSIPRPVSVFLGQKKMAETPVVLTGKAQTAEHSWEENTPPGTTPEEPVLQKISVPLEKMDKPLQQAVLIEKTAKQYVVEKIIPADQRREVIGKGSATEPGETATAQESVTPEEHQEAEENDRKTLPGTLQVAFPRYQLNAPPLYPGLARKRGQEGTVILQVLVNEEGRVDDLKIETTSGFALLDRAAVSSVNKWSFEPGTRGEERIPMWVRVPVTFKLNE